MNNILTAEQWAEWRLSPVTQAFLRYILLKRQEIDRRKMNIISGPAENINPYDLSVLNGIAQACNGILGLNPRIRTRRKRIQKIIKGSNGG